MRRGRRAAAMAAILLPLAGCGLFDREAPARTCPQTGVVGQAARVVKFGAAGRDLTDIAFEAEILSAAGTCSYRREQVVAETKVEFIATAGPMLRGQATATYFVAIVDPRGAVVAKREFPVTVELTAAKPTVQFSDELRQTFPIERGGSVSEYQVIVGFQLTAEELEYNRRLIGR